MAKQYEPPAPRLHLGYVRVSTEDQGTNGVSLDAQEAKVRAHAFSVDRELSEVVRDECSAKDMNRPGMLDILNLIKANRVASVTATKLDRFTRSVRDLADLIDLAKKHDVALTSIGDSLDTATAGGRVVVNILGAIAQWERETISERTSVGMQHLKSKRISTGGKRPRYGFRMVDEPRKRRENGKLVPANLEPDEHEQEGLALILSMVADPKFRRGRGASLRRIAAELHARGFAPPSGDRWYATSVQAVLRANKVPK